MYVKGTVNATITSYPISSHIYLSDFLIRVKVQLLASAKVGDVEPLLGRLVDPSQQIPCPVDGFFLRKRKKKRFCVAIHVHEYDQNVATCTFWPTSAGLHANFLFLVSSEAKGTFSTPKSDRRLVV